MTTYYPSQASYGGHHHHHGHGQPVVYSNPSYGYGGVPASGAVYVPPSSRSYTSAGYYPDYDDYDHRPRRRRRSRHHSGRYSYNPSYAYSYSGVPVSGVGVAAAPVVMQQPVQTAYGYQGYPQHWTFGQRVRRFFGLAPTPNFKYKSDRNTWGFMGYSRRQRYVDPRTGAEVDRDGRQVIRV